MAKRKKGDSSKANRGNRSGPRLTASVDNDQGKVTASSVSIQLNNALKRLRVESNMTQVEVAEELGVTRLSISRTERGLSSLEMLECYLNFFDKTLWFIDKRELENTAKGRPKESAQPKPSVQGDHADGDTDVEDLDLPKW